MFEGQNEPVDIFAETESTKENPVSSSGGLPSSVGGISSSRPARPVAGITPQIDVVASRGPSKILFIAVFLLAAGLVGGVACFFVLRDSGEPGTAGGPESSVPVADAGVLEQDDRSACGDGTCDLDEDKFSCPADCPLSLSACGDGTCQADEGSLDCPADCAVAPTEPVVPPEPANQPLDTDGDGLSDVEETTFGTNPQMADTDADGLTDREESRQYSTDPVNPDTDGDGYVDGEEIRAGYDPKGPGRLLNLPQ